MDKQQVLKDHFGYDSFKPGQEALIDSLLSGRDTLGVMPTGAGKSVCFQVPALMYQGVTLVISPLISLMQDQVTALVSLGIRAAYINSALTQQQVYAVIRNAAQGMYRIIYVAPERLDTALFLELCSKIRVSALIVDEAHCISHWGHDFRPSYLAIPDFIKKLPSRPVVGAFTATATKAVRNDIVRLLEMNYPFELVTGFDRKNLYFEVRKPEDRLADLTGLVHRYCDAGRSGIVYAATRKEVEDITAHLKKEGFAAARYHAGLTDEERRINQEDFIYDRIQVIVATNAFGMGIDKSNVSFVIHHNMPRDMESYYQEAGRAGRDGSPSDCILLFAPRDIHLQRYLIQQSYEQSELPDNEAAAVRKREEKKLSDMINYCTRDACLRGMMLSYFGERYYGSCKNCSFCRRGMVLTDVTVDVQKIMSCIHRVGKGADRAVITAVLQGSQDERIQELGLDALSTFGIMQDRDKKYIDACIEHIMASGMAAADSEGVLHLTRRALPVLKGEERVSARVPDIKGAGANDVDIDTGLMEKLREVRRTQARVHGMPDYVILSDSALVQLCKAAPTTEKQFMKVEGMTRIKYERYGLAFIKAVKDYKKADKPSAAKEKKPTASKDPQVRARAFEIMKELSVSDFEGFDEKLSLSKLIQRLTHDRDLPKGGSLVIRSEVSERLVAHGALARVENEGHSVTVPGEKAAEYGISLIRTAGEDGSEFEMTAYDSTAQEWIVHRIMGEILEI